MTYFTKAGEPIVLRRIWKNARQPIGDSAWVSHVVQAFVDRKLVGYLVIEYIPKKNWKKWFPDVWRLMRLRGKTLLPSHREPLGTKREIWETLQRYDGGYGRNQPTDEQIEKSLRDIARRYYRKEYVPMYKYHVNKPMVGYIDVEPQWQRQGIGRALYLEGAQWMADLGMALYASGTQSESAQASWKSMERNRKIPIQYQNNRRRIKLTVKEKIIPTKKYHRVANTSCIPKPLLTMTLRAQLIRLAYTNPSLREDILPLLRESASQPRGKAQIAIIERVADPRWTVGDTMNFTDLVREPQFRGMHFANLEKATKILAKNGYFDFDGVVIKKTKGFPKTAAAKGSIEAAIKEAMGRVALELAKFLMKEFKEGFKGFSQKPYDAGYMKVGVDSDIINANDPNLPGFITIKVEFKEGVPMPARILVFAKFPQAKREYDREFAFKPNISPQAVAKNLGSDIQRELNDWIVTSVNGV